MIKDYKYLIFIKFIIFNRTQIKLDWKDILLSKNSYIDIICLVIDYNIDITILKNIIKKKLLFKKLYLAQK